MTPNKLIASKAFCAALILEGSWGESAQGDHISTMDLYDGPLAGSGFIEWDIPSMERTEQIGLWYEELENGKRTLVDYDGIFSLPREAIELMESVGIVVDREYR